MSSVYSSSPFEDPDESISKASLFSKRNGLSSRIVFMGPVYIACLHLQSPLHDMQRLIRRRAPFILNKYIMTWAEEHSPMEAFVGHSHCIWGESHFTGAPREYLDFLSVEPACEPACGLV